MPDAYLYCRNAVSTPKAQHRRPNKSDNYQPKPHHSSPIAATAVQHDQNHHPHHPQHTRSSHERRHACKCKYSSTSPAVDVQRRHFAKKVREISISHHAWKSRQHKGSERGENDACCLSTSRRANVYTWISTSTTKSVFNSKRSLGADREKGETFGKRMLRARTTFRCGNPLSKKALLFWVGMPFRTTFVSENIRTYLCCILYTNGSLYLSIYRFSLLHFGPTTNCGLPIMCVYDSLHLIACIRTYLAVDCCDLSAI